MPPKHKIVARRKDEEVTSNKRTLESSFVPLEIDKELLSKEKRKRDDESIDRSCLTTPENHQGLTSTRNTESTEASEMQ